MCWYPTEPTLPPQPETHLMSFVHRRLTTKITGLALTAGAALWLLQQRAYQERKTLLPETKHDSRPTMTVTHSFRTLFAVPLSCDGCIADISTVLHKVPGITSVEGDLKEQLITIEGTAPPSAIVQAIQDTGRDAILRGSGTSNNAAVSILETYYQPARDADAASDDKDHKDRYVRGLARMVQVSSDVTVIDLTMVGVAPGKYFASIREYGDLKDGATSAGPVWRGWDGKATEEGAGVARARRGDLGIVEIGPDGKGSVFLDRELQVWEIIGHALVVTASDESQPGTKLVNDANTVVGVIARSAGVWDNDKTVCSCSGKTLWQERTDEVKKGML